MCGTPSNARLGADDLRGDHAWAIPLVENVLKKSNIATQIVQRLASAWAREMAHPKGAWLGRTTETEPPPIRRQKALAAMRAGFTQSASR